MSDAISQMIHERLGIGGNQKLIRNEENTIQSHSKGEPQLQVIFNMLLAGSDKGDDLVNLILV